MIGQYSQKFLIISWDYVNGLIQRNHDIMADKAEYFNIIEVFYTFKNSGIMLFGLYPISSPFTSTK